MVLNTYLYSKAHENVTINTSDNQMTSLWKMAKIEMPKFQLKKREGEGRKCVSVGVATPNICNLQ